MTETTISVFQKAADLGLKLEYEPPDTLKVESGKPWPRAFGDTLKAHKPALFALMRLPFVMVESHALSQTIFFCKDEHTKAALIQAGAEEWTIYTNRELKILVGHNRTKPLTAADLRRLSEAKRRFEGTIQ